MSDCIGICTFEDGYCIGCGRREDEDSPAQGGPDPLKPVEQAQQVVAVAGQGVVGAK